MASSAEELGKRVVNLFADNMENDDKISDLWETAHNSQDVAYADAYDFSVRTGETLSNAFKAVRKEIPETIDTDFADSLLRGALEDDYKLVSDVSAAVQQTLNEKAGLGLKAQTAPLNTDRINGLVNKFASYDKAENAMWLLDAPVKTFSQSIVDDTIRTNAEFQSKAGLRPRIIRRDSGGCCDWCAKLAGTYDYPGVPREVYRRHANCNCTVEYDPGSGKRVQDVWSKHWTRAEESDKIEERKQIGTDAETFLNDIAEHPKRLGTYTPETFKKTLEEKGCSVKPLSVGNYEEKSFEEGGGYKVNFGGDGLLMYHPEKRSHHGGSYYKISTGKKGIKHYDLNGDELNDRPDI